MIFNGGCQSTVGDKCPGVCGSTWEYPPDSVDPSIKVNCKGSSIVRYVGSHIY